jgi:hypothetical protein
MLTSVAARGDQRDRRRSYVEIRAGDWVAFRSAPSKPTSS